MGVKFTRLPANQNPEGFWSKAQVGKTYECWPWKAHVGLNGYGQIRVAGKAWRAHRYAYFLVHGPIPEGKQVNHVCSNSICVNPAHLYLGNQSQNIKDLYEEGNRRRLYEGEIWLIKKLKQAGVPIQLIMAMFKTTYQTIWSY